MIKNSGYKNPINIALALFSICCSSTSCAPRKNDFFAMPLVFHPVSKGILEMQKLPYEKLNTV